MIEILEPSNIKILTNLPKYYYRQNYRLTLIFSKLIFYLFIAFALKQETRYSLVQCQFNIQIIICMV
jgi:hypothetical protein